MFDWARRIFARRQVQPQQERHAGVTFFPQRSDAGIYVTEERATQQATAWACGSLIARSIAMMPARVMAPRSADDHDGSENLPDHPVANLLHREANAEMSAFKFKEGMLLSSIFSGNGFAEVERDELGRPLALWPIHSNRVVVCRDEAGTLVYEVDNGAAEKVIVQARDMLHLPAPSLCGPSGLSLISQFRHTIGLALAQETFASNFIRNQAAPSGMVKVKSSISTEAFARLKAEFKQANTGTRKAGEPFFGDVDWDWVPFGVSPQDAEFLAQRRFSVEEIARIFAVPPQLVGDSSKATYANFEQAGLNFLSLSLLPWIVRFEQEANRKLLPRAANGRRPYLKLNTGMIVRANLEAQTRSFALGRQWGWLSVNDIRRLSDMEPIGPEGDVYLTPMSMTSADDAPATEDDAEARPPTASSARPRAMYQTAPLSIVGANVVAQEVVKAIAAQPPRKRVTTVTKHDKQGRIKEYIQEDVV